MNIKKVGLTALAGSLVATSAFAGEMSVAGSASIGIEHTNGGHGIAGKTLKFQGRFFPFGPVGIFNSTKCPTAEVIAALLFVKY